MKLGYLFHTSFCIRRIIKTQVALRHRLLSKLTQWKASYRSKLWQRQGEDAAPKLITARPPFSPWPGLAKPLGGASLKCLLSDRSHWFAQGERDIHTTSCRRPPLEMLKVCRQSPGPWSQSCPVSSSDFPERLRQRSSKVSHLEGVLIPERLKGRSGHSCRLMLSDTVQSTSQYADLYPICCYLSRRELEEWRMADSRILYPLFLNCAIQRKVWDLMWISLLNSLFVLGCHKLCIHE